MIRLNIRINGRILGNFVTLLDSGSSICCIKSTVKGISSSDVLSSTRNPVGANGQKLDTYGDVIGQIEIGKNHYSARFTIIDNLCKDVILGNDILGSLGFYIHPGGTKVEIAGVEIGQIFDENCIQAVQTLTCPNVNAKFLCSTQQGADGDGRLVEETNFGTTSAANDQRSEATNESHETYPTNNT